jgi:hypothetical protein
MIRLHVPLPGPFVWVPRGRRRRPSGRHTMALLAIAACVLTALHYVTVAILIGALLVGIIMIIHGIRER